MKFNLFPYRPGSVDQLNIKSPVRVAGPLVLALLGALAATTFSQNQITLPILGSEVSTSTNWIKVVTTRTHHTVIIGGITNRILAAETHEPIPGEPSVPVPSMAISNPLFNPPMTRTTMPTGFPPMPPAPVARTLIAGVPLPLDVGAVLTNGAGWVAYVRTNISGKMPPNTSPPRMPANLPRLPGFPSAPMMAQSPCPYGISRFKMSGVIYANYAWACLTDQETYCVEMADVPVGGTWGELTRFAWNSGDGYFGLTVACNGSQAKGSRKYFRIRQL